MPQQAETLQISETRSSQEIGEGTTLKREDISTIFTTDRRDFRACKRLDGTPYRLLSDDLP